jgi:hypothetical protein
MLAVRSNLAIQINPPSGGTALRLRASITLPVRLGTPLQGSLYAVGGTPPFVFSETTSNLATVGLALNSNGTITGTPTVAGVVSFVARVADAALGSFSATFSINVLSRMASVPGSDSPNDAEFQAPYNYLLKVTGNLNPVYWKVTSGSLPAGLTLGAQGPPMISTTTSGAITVVPTGVFINCYAVPIVGSSVNFRTGEYVYIYDAGALHWMRGIIKGGIVGPPGTIYIDNTTVTNGPGGPTAIPAGATVTTEQGGLIQGTPVPPGGIYSGVISAIDTVNGDTVTFPFKIKVYNHGTVHFDEADSHSNLPPIIVGTPYRTTVSMLALDGKPPYSQWQDNDGTITSLGLSVDPISGAVSGTVNDPTLAHGNNPPYTLEVTCVDALGVQQITGQALVAVVNPQHQMQAQVAGVNAGPAGASTVNYSSDFVVSSDGVTTTVGLASGGGTSFTLTLAPVGTNPNANAMTLVGGNTLNLEAATQIYPGVVTAGAAQTFSGIKTFYNGLVSANGDVTIQNAYGLNVQGGTITVLDGSGNTVCTIPGNPNGTIELGNSLGSGTTPYIDFHYGTGATQDYNVRLINSSNGVLQVLGAFTVTGTITGSNLSGTNTGNVTLAAVGSTPNANGATLTGQALNLQPCEIGFPGVISTGNQNIPGTKTFLNAIFLPGYYLQRAVNGTAGAAVSIIWTSAAYQTVTLTSATPCTISFGAPTTYGTLLYLTVTQPASGTPTTITLPATVKPGMYGTVPQPTATLGAATVYTFFYDGANYWLLECSSATLGGGVTTLAPVGSAPNANAATIAGSTLNLQPADGANPGVMTIAAQTFAGLKTFNGGWNAGATCTITGGTGLNILDASGNGVFALSGNVNGSMEIGNSLGASTTPFIDWHFGIGSAQDFNVRVINNANEQLTITSASNYATFSVVGRIVANALANTVTALGVVGAAATCDFTKTAGYTLTLTSATPCTLTFTAPQVPWTIVEVTITQPASGTLTTVVWPGNCRFPGHVPQACWVLGNRSTFVFMWNGSEYISQAAISGSNLGGMLGPGGSILGVNGNNYAAAIIQNAGQGGFLTYNMGFTGEENFVSYHGAGVVGGWMWYDTTDGAVMNLRAQLIGSTGEFKASNYGCALVDKGSPGAAVAIDWRTGKIQAVALTSATNITATFTAPTNPCELFLRVTAPPSGTTPTITWPATVKGAPPTTVTLAKISMLEFLWDGTNYFYMGGCLNS